MTPDNPLPHSDEFRSPDEYVDALLDFTSSSPLFQTLCGGVHILDFFTSEQSLFTSILPPEWHDFLTHCPPPELLNLLARDDLDGDLARAGREPPETFVEYIRTIRRLSLGRDLTPKKQKLPVLPRPVAVGMNPKKVHEVTNFSDYVDRLLKNMSRSGHDITHLVDFGSGQNYLGRSLGSPPYNHHVVAVEGREENIAGAKSYDMAARLAKKPTVVRNKKLYQQMKDDRTPEDQLSVKAIQRMAKRMASGIELPADDGGADFRGRKEIAVDAEYEEYEEGKGYIQYVEG
ncbi:MAG: methyltransferase, partial [Acidobacteria bacterium]|nr:methyltransferase [Acidobacteriota bacterium]